MRNAKLLECVTTKKIGGIKEALRNGANIDYIDGRGDFALQLAARDDKYFTVAKLLIEKGANVNLVNQSGISALMEASKNGCIKLVRLLLFNGALTNLKDWQQKTALMHLCSNKAIPKAKFLEVAQQIIKHGIDINHQSSSGKSALMIACAENNLLAVDFLLRHGAKVNLLDNTGQSALMMACKQGLKEIAELLIQYGAHIDVRDKEGKTALITAYEASTWNKASGWNVECGRLLIGNSGVALVNEILTRACEEGRKEWVELVLINTPDIDHNTNTLLMNACMSGNLDTVALVLDSGAHVDTQDNEGKTALIRACEMGYDFIVELLLRKKAQVDVQDKEGETALMKAMEYKKIVQLLLNSGAQVDIQDNQGQTALIKFCEVGKDLELLLNSNADVNLQDKEGRTALMIACEKLGKEMPPPMQLHHRVPEDQRYTEKSEHGSPRANSIIKLLLNSGAQVHLQDINGVTALMIACQKGDEKSIENLLERHSEDDVNLQDSGGKTAFMRACMFGNLDIAAILLYNGAHVDTQDNEGKTALMKACKEGDNGIVQLLLNNRAQVNMQDNEGKTALMMLNVNGFNIPKAENIMELLKKYAKVNMQDNEGRTALMKYCEMDSDSEIIQLLLDTNTYVDLQDNKGRTALMIACERGNFRNVKVLLDFTIRADVNLQDNEGKTALMKTCELLAAEDPQLLELRRSAPEGEDRRFPDESEFKNGNVISIVKLLLDNGAQVHLQDSEGVTALMIASQKGVETCVEYLIETDSDVNLQDNEGKTALMRACGVGIIDIVQILFNKAAHINLRDNTGQTALMFACKYGWADVVKLLLKRGAQVYMQDNSGESAFTTAAKIGLTKIVDLLLIHGATQFQDTESDEEASSQASMTESEEAELLKYYSPEDSKTDDPHLIAASELGDKDGTELLLNDGADIESKDSKGRTALIIASGNGHTTVTDLLLERGANIDSQDDEGYSALMTACKNGQVQTTSCLLDQYADTFLKNSDGKTAFDLAMESSNIELLSLFTKLRKKPSHPGILFLEGAKRETVTMKEKIIDLQEVGISLSIPENALPPTDPPLQLEIQPCFSGSFYVPQDVELVSPAYTVKPSRKVAFQKEVLVKIWHHANLESEEDCKDMMFLSASTRPQYREDTPVYVFKKIRGAKGSFRPGEEQPVGQIALKHFCTLALGKRKQEEVSGEAEQKRRKGW